MAPGPGLDESGARAWAMNPTRYRHLMELFDQACVLPEVEREALVADARARDPELARDLLAMLDQDDAQGDAFDSQGGRFDAAALAFTVTGNHDADGTGGEIGDDPDDDNVEPGPDPRLGTTIADRYQLQELVGRGGMGRVYRALDEVTRATVAVKLLRPDLVHDRRQVQRFRREFRAISRIDHPGCLEVFAEGTHGDERYLVMEYVPGGNLGRLVGAPGEVLLPVLVGVTAALDCVHDRGIIHRDLKPANVLLAPGDPPVPRLADFGIVKLLGATSTGLTDTGAVVGTIDYLAPEALAGSELDARSDLYSLGCMIFTLWAGRPVFIGDPLERLHIRLDRPAPRLSAVVDDLPPGLDDLVARLLARDPGERPRRAADVARELMALSAEMGPGARQQSARDPEPGEDGSRHPAPIGREPLLDAVQAAVEHALKTAIEDPAVRLVALCGAAAPGRSALASAVERALPRDGHRVVMARAPGAARGPFAPFLAVLETLAALDPAPGDRSETRSWPGAGHQGDELPAALPADDGFAARRQLVRALASRLGALHERRPVVLILEDLHRAESWAIELLLELLAELAAGADSHPADSHPVIVAIMGPAGRATLESAAGQEPPTCDLEVASPARALVENLARARDSDPLLDPSALRVLLDQAHLRLDPSGRVASTIELAPALSSAVGEVLRGRLASLGETTRAILAVAAVAGPGFDGDLLCRAADRSEDEVRGALDEALRAAIAAPAASRTESHSDRDEYHFEYPQVAEYLRAELDPAVRARHHDAIGEALQERSTASPATLAFHFARGSDRTRAFHHLRRAGSAAQVARDHAAARRHVERALERVDSLLDATPAARESARHECAEDLADALIVCNRATRAADLLRELTDLPAPPATRARRLRKLGMALLRTTDVAGGLTALEQGLTSLGGALPRSRPASLWRALCDETRDLTRRLLGRPPVRDPGGEEQAVLHRELAFMHRWIDLDRARAHRTAFARLAHRLGLAAHPIAARMLTGDEASDCDDLDRGVQRAESVGDRFLESVALCLRGNGLALQGCWQDAAGDLRRAAALATELGATWLAGEADRGRSELELFSGQFDESSRTARRLLDADERPALPAFQAFGDEIRAIEALLHGRFRDAVIYFDRAWGHYHAHRLQEGWGLVTELGRCEAVLCLVDEQGRDAVPDLVARLGRSARFLRRRASRTPIHRSYAALVAGLHAAHRGWRQIARRRFARAHALSAASGSSPPTPWIHARLVLEGCRLGDSRPAASAELDRLAHTLETAGLHGINAWLARVRLLHGL